MSDGPRNIDVDEGAPIGAAPTLPAGRNSQRPEGGRRRRIPRPSGTPFLILAVILLLALVPLFNSGLKKTPRNKIGISYGGGPIEGTHFQRIVPPGHALFFNGWFDPLYLYPADQQSYIISKQANVGSVKKADSVIAPSRDRVQVEYQVAVYFKLDTDRLRAFHDELGLKYAAYTTSGWNNLLQDTFRQQIENALQEETRRYDVADIFSNARLLDQIQGEVQRSIDQRLIAALGQQFFCGPTFVPGGTCGPIVFIIKKVDLPTSVVKAFEAQRTAQVGIAQRTNEAQAIDALNAALSRAGLNYVLLRAIESGQIKFWVLPSGNGVTIQAPNDGSSPSSPSGK